MSLADHFQVCTLHTVDRDHALTTEAHHIIPQAWQHFWKPNSAPPAAVSKPRLAPSAVLPLWDPRTIVQAPTCHRNVHFFIVKLMRSYHAGMAEGVVGIAAAQTTVVKALGLASRLPKELGVANTGLQRYVAVGGDLHALGDAGEWGEA